MPEISIKQLVNFSPKQEMALSTLMGDDCKFLLYGGAAYGGKATTLDTQILTPFGFRSLGDMKAGDAITNPDSSVGQIVLLHPIEVQNVYEVKFEDGDTVRCSHNHLWQAWRGRKGVKQKNERVFGYESRQVVTTGTLWDWMRSGYQPLIPTNDVVPFNVQNRWHKIEIDPYFLGLLLGDGCITGTVSNCGLTTADGEIIKYVRGIYPAVGESVKENHSALRIKGDGNKSLIASLKKYKLYGCNSSTKFIPDVYKYSSVENRFAFIRGIMDTDGYVSKDGKVYYTTVSLKLSEDVAFVLRSLGAVVTISTKQPIKGKLAYNLYIRHKNPQELFNLQRKKNRCKSRQEEIPKRIISITPLGKEEMRCITVSNPNGLFIVNKFTVTHNSYFLRWSLVLLLGWWFREYGLKNVQVGLFCEDYPALRDRQLIKIHAEFPGWLGRWKEEEKNFYLTKSMGSGIISCRNLDDSSKYASAEFAAIGVDEATKNVESTFTNLRWRLRWNGLPHPKFICCSNPGGIGHAWVKKLWIDSLFDPNETEAALFKFVQAKYDDNPYTSPDYLNTLNSLPDKLRKAFRDGDWTVFAGQFFDEWSSAHIIKPFAIPAEWERFIALDYGYSGGFSSVGWYAVDFAGKVYRYREIYTQKRTYSELAYDILAANGNDVISYLAADPAIWGDRPHHDTLIGESGGDTMAEIMYPAQEDEEIWQKRSELNIPRDIQILLQKADNNRITGWGRIREYLRVVKDQFGTESPSFFVFDTCRNFIRLFPAAIFDEIHLDRRDDLVCDEDHIHDECRYGLMSRPESPVMAIKEKPLDTNARAWQRVKDMKTGLQKRSNLDYLGSEL